MTTRKYLISIKIEIKNGYIVNYTSLLLNPWPKFLYVPMTSIQWYTKSGSDNLRWVANRKNRELSPRYSDYFAIFLTSHTVLVSADQFLIIFFSNFVVSTTLKYTLK